MQYKIMKKVIRLTESELTRLIKRVIVEQTAQTNDKTQFHRYRDGGDPGIETFFSNPTQAIGDELRGQLESDKYASGPEFLKKTNIGGGTRRMFIILNNVKMTPAQFIVKVLEDASEGYCHTINEYNYNNRFIGATKITIKTTIGQCKKQKVDPKKQDDVVPKPKQKQCKHNVKQPKELIGDTLYNFQEFCAKYDYWYAEYTDGTKVKCGKQQIDGKWGCCSATCYKIRKKTLG